MVEINNKTKSRINSVLVKLVAEKFLKKNGKSGHEISIVFVGDKLIRSLNKKYRKKDKITDILSFVGDGNFLGEVIIDYAQIKRQAEIYKHSAMKELIFILVHGLFHLLGHEDETEKGRIKMEKLSEKFINNLKI